MRQHPARPPLSLVVIVATLVVAGVSRIVAAATSQDAAVITTIAGGGPNGLPALIVDLGRPRGVAVDASGSVFISVTDVRTLAGRIFKIHAGVLTVYAGNGLPGFSGDGGPALRAGFDALGALALDGAGNLFVSDGLRVRRIDAATGIVTTVAGDGSGLIGDEGVPATRTGLFPGALAVAANGDLFISGPSGAYGASTPPPVSSPPWPETFWVAGSTVTAFLPPARFSTIRNSSPSTPVEVC